ncbi:MAG: hypothetical protein KA248_02815 [Kiritimatiellae bacterium]|nr:hypothetical protein [Kiritimatiellia bacterium]
MKTYRRLSGPLLGHRSSFGRRQQLTVAILLPVLFFVAVLQWRWIGQNKQSLFRLSGSWYVERLPCELCGQMGFIQSGADPRQRILCPVCQGRGGGYIRRVDDRDVICPACGGMGRIWDEPDGAHFCSRCEGRGLIRVEAGATNAPSGTTP